MKKFEQLSKGSTLTRNRKKLAGQPGWWPLKEYSRELTDVEWIAILFSRLGAQAAWEVVKKDDRASKGIEFFNTFIVNGKDLRKFGETFIEEGGGLGVRDLSVFEAHLFAEVNQGDKYTEHIKLAKAGAAFCRGSKSKSDFPANWYEALLEQRKTGEIRAHSAVNNVGEKGFFDVLEGWAPCVVDMHLDDETLKKSFELWLLLNRNAQSYVSKPIDSATLAEWQRKAVLPAFDLLLWSDITGTRLTEPMIGKLLWPDEAMDKWDGLVDTGARFRKVTKPTMAFVFNWDRMKQLQRQIEGQRRLHFPEVGQVPADSLIRGLRDNLKAKSASGRKKPLAGSGTK